MRGEWRADGRQPRRLSRLPPYSHGEHQCHSMPYGGGRRRSPSGSRLPCSAAARREVLIRVGLNGVPQYNVLRLMLRGVHTRSRGTGNGSRTRPARSWNASRQGIRCRASADAFVMPPPSPIASRTCLNRRSANKVLAAMASASEERNRASVLDTRPHIFLARNLKCHRAFLT